MDAPTRTLPAEAPAPRSRREEILSAALRLFAEHGVHTVTTRQIAQAVGISQPSLYAHFPTKQALSSEVCVRAFEDLTRRADAVLAALRAGKGEAADIARVYIDFGLSQPDAYRLAFMVEQSDLKAHDPGDPILTAGLRAFAAHREAVRLTLGAGLDSDALEILAQSLWLSMHGLVSLLIARPGFPWVDRQRLIETHIQRVFGGAPAARGGGG